MIHRPQLNLFAPLLMCVILILWALLFVRPVERALPVKVFQIDPDCEYYSEYCAMLEIEYQKREREKANRSKGGK